MPFDPRDPRWLLVFGWLLWRAVWAGQLPVPPADPTLHNEQGAPVIDLPPG